MLRYFVVAPWLFSNPSATRTLSKAEQLRSRARLREKGNIIEQELYQLIKKAKRELRQASGEPLTLEEQDDERRVQELHELGMFVLTTFGVSGMYPLKMNTIWHGGTAVIAMKAEDIVFHLRKTARSVALVFYREDGERLLLEIPTTDTSLANRVYSAIGDEIEPMSDPGKEEPNA